MTASQPNEALSSILPPSDNAPTKRDLTSWWKQFTRGAPRREEEKALEIHTHPGIFGVPLQTSIRYANVAISLYDDEGRSYIYGYVPIVVAKCGVFLKEKATEVEGIFRLSGSEKRIKELRLAFDSPDRYGKGLDWTNYTVHDAANVLRRYFNQLPEPIIPLDFYSKFREPLQAHFLESRTLDPERQVSMHFEDEDSIIETYQNLIVQLPPLNRQLLLYILDLLAVFASKSDMNKMTTSNLAAIFQPGTLFHPKHNMAPDEYRLNQFVLIFLIDNQDHFLIGMQGTAADAKTVQEVESGPPTPAWNTATASKPKLTLGRSASVSSLGGESIRHSGNLWRNHSVSSRISSVSNPTTPNGSGIQRSNTLPRRSSYVSSEWLSSETNIQSQISDSVVDGSAMAKPTGLHPNSGTASRVSNAGGGTQGKRTEDMADQPGSSNSLLPPSHASASQPSLFPQPAPVPAPPRSPGTRQSRLPSDSGPGAMSRLVSTVIPQPSTSRDQSRQPNKLRKLRAPSVQSSSHSSTQSLPGGPPGPVLPGLAANPAVSNGPSEFLPQPPVLNPNSLLDTQAAASRSASTITDVSENENPSELSPKLRGYSGDYEKDKAQRGGWRKIFKSDGARSDRERSDNLPPSPNSKTLVDGKQMQSMQSVLAADSGPPPEFNLSHNPGSTTSVPATHPAAPEPPVSPRLVNGSGMSPRAGLSPAASHMPVMMPPLDDIPGLNDSRGSSVFPNDLDEKDKTGRGLIARVRERIQDFKDERKEREAEKARTKSPEGRRFEVFGAGGSASVNGSGRVNDPFVSMQSLSASLNGMPSSTMPPPPPPVYGRSNPSVSSTFTSSALGTSCLTSTNAPNSGGPGGFVNGQAGAHQPLSSVSTVTGKVPAVGSGQGLPPVDRPSLLRGHSVDTTLLSGPSGKAFFNNGCGVGDGVVGGAGNATGLSDRRVVSGAVVNPSLPAEVSGPVDPTMVRKSCDA